MTSDLTITTSHGPAGPVLAVTGDLDYVTAPQLRAAATALVLESGQLLTFDLSDLSFCDSSGINALLAIRHHTHAQAAQLALANVPMAVTRVLGMLGLTEIFHTTPKPDAG